MTTQNTPEATPAPTPLQLVADLNKSALSRRIREQAAKMEQRVPSQARTVRARSNGYTGPMTRTELAAQAARKFASR